MFTKHLYRPGRADEGRALRRNSPALAGVDGLQAGSWDAAIVDELGCGPADLVVDKVRFDAFQWTPLEPLLRGLADCCAAKTRRLHELSIEVLSSYELAEVASVSEGFDVAAGARADAA